MVALLLSAGNILLFYRDVLAWPIIVVLYLSVTSLFLRTSPSLRKISNWIGLWIAALILLFVNFTIVTHLLPLSYSSDHYSWGVIGVSPLYFLYSLIVVTTFFLIIQEKSAKTLDSLFYTYYHFSATKVSPQAAKLVSIALLEICGLAFTIPLLLLTRLWPFNIWFTVMNQAIVVGIFALIWLLFLLTYFLVKKRYEEMINQHERYNKRESTVTAIIWPLITLIGTILYLYLTLTLPIPQDQV